MTDIDEFRRVIKENNTEFIINEIITTAYLGFNDEIKMDKSLTEAYEGILTALVEIGVEEAAVLLDEFRIH
ncbi:MAG: hypothetical protein VB031_08960 [Eubacteriaceae bacterium]|nr:hypothetical protein [Eubacteriaceae bacterium]